MRTRLMISTLCVGAVFATSSATAATTAPSRVIHYLSIGDSAPANPAFTGGVAAGAGAALHAQVALRQILEEGAVSDFIARMKTTAEIRSDVRSADVITVSMGANEIAAALGTPNGAGIAETALERSYRRLLDQLTRLRPTSKTAYRLLTEYDTPWYFPRAQGKQFTAAILRFNRFVCAQAAARKVKCADVYTAINGKDGSRDPRRAGLLMPDGHPTEKGAKTMARVVVDVGFAPLR